MEKTVRTIGMLKWLGFPLGGVMFFFTSQSFGIAAGIVLGAVAGLSFWILMKNEQSRLIGQTIANVIRQAISETANVDSLIEIKRLRSGIIARVYLINAREKVATIHQAVAKRMEACSLKRYLWIMQMTDMPRRSALRETQKMLNEKLLEEILSRHRGDQQ